MWTALERLRFRLLDNPAVMAVGAELGLHRHDYKADAPEAP
jgi:hypothetical protein